VKAKKNATVKDGDMMDNIHENAVTIRANKNPNMRDKACSCMSIRILYTCNRHEPVIVNQNRAENSH
jgi:hypothetical protein